ncbi:MAG: class I SAM-dependent methyltransferase [Spirochaetales bacterium]|nr:class I SAM-dependent methyltransferase [Spirochaetales bacterium]
MNNKKNLKVQYGWYAGNFLIGCGIIGVFGLALIFTGIFIPFPLADMLFMAGLIVSILFLWPALGMVILNLRIFSSKTHYDYLKRFKAPKVLDCGCGTGRHAIAMAKALPKGGYLTGIDIYNTVITGNSLETVKRNARIESVANITDFRHGSITEIPFKDNSFDIISVQSVLHEIHKPQDLQHALAEIKRVLKKDGLLIIGEWHSLTPFLVFSMGFLTLMMATIVFKTKYFWRKIISRAGLEIVREINNRGFIIFNCKIA